MARDSFLQRYKRRRDDDGAGPPRKRRRGPDPVPPSFYYLGGIKTWTAYWAGNNFHRANGLTLLYTPLATLNQGTGLYVPVPSTTLQPYAGFYDQRYGRQIRVIRIKYRVRYQLTALAGTQGGSMSARMIIALDHSAEDGVVTAPNSAVAWGHMYDLGDETASAQRQGILSFRNTNNTKRFRILKDETVKVNNPYNALQERAQFEELTEGYIDCGITVPYSDEPDTTPIQNNLLIGWMYTPGNDPTQLTITTMLRLQYHDV